MWGEVRVYIEEAQTCIEAAMVAGEAVAAHGIVPSRDFEKVMEQLHIALDVLDKAKLPEVENVVQFLQPMRG